MNKKLLPWILGIAFVVIVLVVLLVFVLSGGEEPPMEVTVNLEGKWKVVSTVEADVPAFPEDEYYVFTADSASAYRGGDTPIATSSYTLKPAEYPNLSLELPEISRSYIVLVLSDNYIRLYENPSAYTNLIRIADDIPAFAQEDILTCWDVAYRSTDGSFTDEKLQFEADGTLLNYRNGLEEPFMSLTYYWNDAGELCVDQMGKQMRCIPYTDSILYLLDVATGDIWELHITK